MPPTPHRRPLLAAATLGLLTSCAPITPLAAQDAVAHYEALTADLGTAMSAELEHRPVSEPVVEGEDGCYYSPGFWSSGAVIDPDPDGSGWRQRIAVLDPVLAEHGFEELGSVERRGGQTSAEASDSYGAVLTVTDQGEIRITDARVDAEECTPEALGLG